MSFELSFSPEFFLAEGEPYDRADSALNSQGKPTSVWSAIAYFKEHNPEEWKQMAKDVFDLPKRQADLLMAEAVLEKVQETNTCSTLGTPVQVWIDAEGDYRLEVWDSRG